MSVGPLRSRENMLSDRATHATSKALEQIQGDRTLAHQSKARTADLLKSIPDPKGAQALKPRGKAINPKTTQRTS